MFNVYKVLVTSNTGMQHVDDVDGEWKTVRETNRAIERLCRGPAAELGLTNEVKVVDALDLVVFLAQKGDSGRLAMVSP